MKTSLILTALFAACLSAGGEPLLSSWYTKDSGRYARLFTSTAMEATGTSVTTWSRGTGVQNAPAYSGVQEISYSANYVYVRSTGLASHVMGPWYLDALKSQNFPNFPGHTNAIFRFPRHPAVAATKTNTPGGATGFYVNGVAMFDMRDTFSYRNASGQDATPVNGLTGDGIWNRDAWHNEAVTFDAALAHQAGEQYHYHAQPPALRHQLGDHVDYNPAANRYRESTAPVTRHSPILAWAADGYPVYGPYGYSSALDPDSGLRRLTSGFVLRNGQNGTTDLNTTGRTTLPAWASRVQNRAAALAANQHGPAVNTTYALGRYLEDYDYLGDRGLTQGMQFDLNEQNVRWCVTPEFPAGTHAYFCTIAADGTPAYPFSTGRQFFGTASGGSVQTINEPVTVLWKGGPDTGVEFAGITRDAGTGAVTLSWASVDGGTYKVESSATLTDWSDLQTNIPGGGTTTSRTDNTAGSAPRRFYRASRTALATYDSTGNGGTGTGTGGGTQGIATVAPATGNSGTALSLTITLNTAFVPAPPPNNVQPTAVTLTRTGAATITATSSTRNTTTGIVTSNFALPAGATAGAYNVNATFGPNTWSLANGFQVN